MEFKIAAPKDPQLTEIPESLPIWYHGQPTGLSAVLIDGEYCFDLLPDLVSAYRDGTLIAKPSATVMPTGKRNLTQILLEPVAHP